MTDPQTLEVLSLVCRAVLGAGAIGVFFWFIVGGFDA